MFPKAVVSGGTGIYYSADTIWILGRQQDKEGTEIKGYHFIINVEKSRYVKEKSKIPLSVSFEGGIQRYSGLLDVALAGGFVGKPSNGWYQKVDRNTGEFLDPKVREKETLCEEFWSPLLKDPAFQKYITEKIIDDKNNLLSLLKKKLNDINQGIDNTKYISSSKILMIRYSNSILDKISIIDI
jgi:hypothetical protein